MDHQKTSLPKKELRKFGIIQALALQVLAGLLLWRQNSASVFLAISGLAVFLTAVFAPGILKPDYKLFKLIGKIISLVVTKIVLIILFYAVIFPVSLLARLTGKKFLDLDIDKQKSTYWLPHKIAHRQKEEYLKQF